MASISDLTGTTWELNASLSIPQTIDCRIDFVSNNTVYDGITITSGSLAVFYYTDFSDFARTKVYNNGWVSTNYRTIEITGGTGATNASFISWLESNAVQRKKAISLENLKRFKTNLSSVPTCYRHDVVITDSSNSSKICFNLILKNSSALTVKTALTCLFGALTAWKKTSIPITIVTSEWSSAVFFPRCVLSSISTSGSSVTSFTLTPTEGSIVYDQVQGILTISSAARSFTGSNLSIEDSVVGLSL